MGHAFGNATITAMTAGIIERYAAYLPVTSATPRITLGEGSTPLVRSSRIGPAIGLDQLYFKYEGLNPSGSFKDRGMALATARAVEAGAPTPPSPPTGKTSAPAPPDAPRPGPPPPRALPPGGGAPRQPGPAPASGAARPTPQRSLHR